MAATFVNRSVPAGLPGLNPPPLDRRNVPGLSFLLRETRKAWQMGKVAIETADDRDEAGQGRQARRVYHNHIPAEPLDG